MILKVIHKYLIFLSHEFKYLELKNLTVQLKKINSQIKHLLTDIQTINSGWIFWLN